MGDFNQDWNDSKSLAKKELDFTTESLGLFQQIKENTRYGVRQGTLFPTCIDIFFFFFFLKHVYCHFTYIYMFFQQRTCDFY